MKRIATPIFLLLFALVANVSTLKAQLNDTETFRLGEVDPYFSAYLKPFGQAMATGLSGGWTHTAKVHGTLGFDITISGSFVKVPEADFEANTSDFDMPNYNFGNAPTIPTIAASSDINQPTISRSFENDELGDVVFDGIQGVGLAFGGGFAIQGAIGLPKGTELIVRLMPDLSKTVNNAMGDDMALEKTNMWGLGVKHDIKQWIPAISKVPFLQISGLLAYSKFQTGFAGDAMRFDPSTFGDDIQTGNANLDASSSVWDDQKFTMAMSSFTGSLLVGANIPVFQPYIGLGFNSSKFEAGLKGNYPIIEINAAEQMINDYETDPLTSVSKKTNVNFQAGARLKLGFFVFHYTFTAQEYKMHTGGIAFTFR